mmetsp:Transcript_15689/g.22965  ORF Transcript_15689/g.22965 Transcript_15689/m.22965 type:complete len:139 (-) Transcript_15689:521-937(-)
MMKSSEICILVGMRTYRFNKIPSVHNKMASTIEPYYQCQAQKWVQMSALTHENEVSHDEDTEATSESQTSTEMCASDILPSLEIDRHHLGVASLSVLVFYSVSGESYFLSLKSHSVFYFYVVFGTCVVPNILKNDLLL